MFKDLEKYIQDEKYHGLLIIGSGRLKEIERVDFILNISTKDILLATRCAVECEEDISLEDDLAKISVEYAKDFSTPYKSARGFLSLILLDKFALAIPIIANAETETKSHVLQYFRKIISILVTENKESTFWILNTLLDLKKYRVFTSLISFITAESRINAYIDFHGEHKFLQIIKKLFTEKNFKGRSYCLSHLISVVKVNEQVIDISYITYLIEKSIGFGNSVLALNIIQKQDLEHKFSIDYIVEKSLKTRKKSSLILVSKLANSQDIDTISRENIQQKLVAELSNMLSLRSVNDLSSTLQSIRVALKVSQELNIFASVSFDFLQCIFDLLNIKDGKAWELASKIAFSSKLKKYEIFQNINKGKNLEAKVRTQQRIDLFCFLYHNHFKFYDQVLCECCIIEIHKTYIFVIIKGSNQSVSISIDEINTCFRSFEQLKFYGENIYVGQTIVAKLINCDKGNIRLSLNF